MSLHRVAKQFPANMREGAVLMERYGLRHHPATRRGRLESIFHAGIMRQQADMAEPDRIACFGRTDEPPDLPSTLNAWCDHGCVGWEDQTCPYADGMEEDPLLVAEGQAR